MASGSFKTNVVTAAGSGYYRQIEVIWSSTNNATNNTSTVSWTAYSRATDSNNTARWVNAWNITVTINGTAKNINGSTTKALYKDTVIGSGSVTVAHNSDGRKTGVPVAISASIWDSSKTNATYSGTINLDPNPVYTLTLTPGSNTTISASRTASSGGGATGSISSGAKLYYGDVIKISAAASANFKLTSLKVNNSDFTSGNTHTVTGNVTVTSAAQALASVISVGSSSVALGQNITITVTKYNSSYAHSIAWSFAGHSGYITSGGGTQSSEAKYTNTSVTFSVPNAWGSYIPSITSGVCTLTCKTYSGTSSTTQLGSSTTCSFTVSATSASSGPQITTSTVEDINAATIALTGSSSRLIRYMSTARCTLSASSRDGATLTAATIAGLSVMPSGSPTTITGATKTFNEVTSSSYTFAVSDSRGYSTSVPVSATMIDYVRMTCVPVVQRTTVGSTTVTLKATGSFFNGAFNAAGTNNNTLTISYRYKPNTEGGAYPSEWSTIPSNQITKSGTTYSTSTITVSGTFDVQNSYTFQIKATDGVGNNILTTVEKEITIRRGLPVFDWGKKTFNFNVPITFEDQQQTKHAQIAFRNNLNTTPEHPHSMSIFGGDPASSIAFMVYDHTTTDNPMAPFLYKDGTRDIFLYYHNDSGNQSFVADFPNEVKYDTTTGLYYRTWYSGTAEIWGKVTFTSVVDDSTTGGGALHYSPRVYKTIPLTLSAGAVNLTGETNATWAINTELSSSGTSFSTRIMRGLALGGVDYTFHVHIIGVMSGYVDRVCGEGGTPTPSRGAAVVIHDEVDQGGGIIKHIEAVDLSNDTVDAAHLAQGYTAHDRNGNAITGQLT